jgi:hypothetical protein
MSKRTFTIQASEIGFTGGEYKSDIPSKAAKKAGKRIFKLVSEVEEYKKFASKESIKFILREKSRGSEKKTYFYEASIKNLKSPKYIEVKAPGNAAADKNGMVKYAVTKEVKVQTCSESHVNHLF